MENSYHLSDDMTRLTGLVHMDAFNSFIGIPKHDGYLCIADSVCVSVKVKPSQKHLDNMFETFGWTWKDV